PARSLAVGLQLLAELRQLGMGLGLDPATGAVLVVGAPVHLLAWAAGLAALFASPIGRLEALHLAKLQACESLWGVTLRELRAARHRGDAAAVRELLTVHLRDAGTRLRAAREDLASLYAETIAAARERLPKRDTHG